MVNWLKQIASPAATAPDLFAGDVMNWVIQYHDDIDLAAGDPNGIASIATETRFTSSKLAMWDLNKDHVIDFLTPNYAEDKTISLPTTMPQNDHMVTEDATQQLTGKTISVDSNVLNFSTNAAGDLLKGNGTFLARFPRGTSLQVLRTNSGATDVEWATLDNERLGKATASGNAINNSFSITHGLATNPTYTWVNCSSLTEDFTYTTDTTSITVTFATPPPTGSSNVIIYWRVVA